MALKHEATIIGTLQYQIGDMKLVGYDISFTLHAIVEPANDLGWLLLNGASLSTTTYAGLFAKYGYSFGGSGASFSLPDFTDGKVPVPKGVSAFTTFAATGGEITHVMAAGELGAHSHPDTFSASASAHSHSGSASVGNTDGSHSHFTNTYLVASGGFGSSGGLAQDAQWNPVAVTSAAASHTHGFSATMNNNSSGNLNVSGSIGATGGGGAHNNMSPYQVAGGWLVRYR
jgi:microcystin-dependent protein